MKAYVAPIPSTLSRGIHRVADALARHAPPDVEIVDHQADADLLLCHMIGQEGWTEHLHEIAKRGKRFAIFMYCLRTTSTPNCAQWLAWWREAAVVASYYDLPLLAFEDGVRHLAMNFVRTPLGVDTSVFNSGDVQIRTYLVGTSGYVAGTECVGEWAAICNTTQEQQFHLGPDLPDLAHRRTVRNAISDARLASEWARCFYVSGLRRSEGFELPAFEGLACGARPVMFAREDAYHWLGDHAEYIAEGSPDVIIAQLEAVVRRGYRPVTPEEIRWVGETFSWARMAERFWAAVPR